MGLRKMIKEKQKLEPFRSSVLSVEKACTEFLRHG